MNFGKGHGLGYGCRLVMKPAYTEPDLSSGYSLGPVPKAGETSPDAPRPGVVTMLKPPYTFPATASGMPYRATYATRSILTVEPAAERRPSMAPPPEGLAGGDAIGQPPSSVPSAFFDLLADAGAVLVGGVAIAKTDGWENTLGWVLAVVGSMRVMNDFSRMVSR